MLPFVVLLACAVAYTEMSRPIERVREHFAGSPHIDLNSVWMFASALLLPPSLAALVIAASFGYRWLRVRRHVVHRQVFSAAATILAATAATVLLRLLGVTSFGRVPHTPAGLGVVVAAGLVFLLVNTVLVSAAVYVSNAEDGVGRWSRIRAALGSPTDYSLEAATIGLGILLAWALVAWPAALVLIVGITLVLHRCVLLRQLREQASTDGKTGLLNADAWQRAARAQLFRAGRLGTGSSLLMLDLDHFKAVNDRYGHQAGDEVLRAVADTLRAELRGSDLIGRFGGEEFTMLLPETTVAAATLIADRLRHRISERVAAHLCDGDQAPVTASIGIAEHPRHGSTVETLIRAADTALYDAKAAGRDRTRVAWQRALETA
ncbi:MAG TPA: GGDEF domain-containing protein [Pseudonocardiaceae bacterium]